MGPFKLLIFAFTATAAAQTAPSQSVVTQPVTHSESVSSTPTPSSPNLPPPLSSTGGMRHEGPSDSASATVSVILSTTVIAGTPWPMSGFTVQTSVQTNVTSVATIPVIDSSTEVLAPSSSLDASHSGHQSTIVITTTASGATSKAASPTSSAPPSKSSSAGLQHGAASAGKVGSLGIALAMLCGVLGA